MTHRAIDVLGFAGGFTLGVVQAGFELVGKRELPGGFGVPNCEANRALLGGRWQAEACAETEWSVPSGGAEYVFGNPPCSGFSVMSSKQFRGADSKINHCMWAFVGYVARVRPHVAVFESVQQAFTKEDGHDLMRRLRAHLEEATGDTWTLYHVRHNVYTLGGPAERRRYFWVAARLPFGVEPPDREPTHTLADVIGDLENLGQTWLPQPYRSPPSAWAAGRRSETYLVDGHVSLDSPLTRRIRDLIDAVAWNPGESIASVVRRHWDEHARLPDSFAHNEEKIVKNDFNMGFTTPTRWRGDRPARVITGGALDLVIHPRLARTITHREAARVMGFPDDWRILPLRRSPGLRLTWGKGITVDAGRWIGGWVRRALDGCPGGFRGAEIGEREFDVNVTAPVVSRPGKV